MFIVVKRFDDKKVGVLDTDDWTVEIISVEQLKLVESLGHKVVFDDKYSFVCDLYDNAAYGIDCTDALQRMIDVGGFELPSVSSKHTTAVISEKTYGVAVFCFVTNDKFYIFTVKATHNSYKLYYKGCPNKKLNKKFGGFIGDFISFDKEGLFALEYYDTDAVFYKSYFNYNTNFKYTEVA